MSRTTSLLTNQVRTPPGPPSPHPQNARFLTPLYSNTSESIFSQPLSFHIHLNPPGVPPPHPLFTPGPRKALCPRRTPRYAALANSSALNSLPPLFLSCPSFSPRHPLFSVVCSLFSQNRGGGVSPAPGPIYAHTHRPPAVVPAEQNPSNQKSASADLAIFPNRSSHKHLRRLLGLPSIPSTSSTSGISTPVLLDFGTQHPARRPSTSVPRKPEKILCLQSYCSRPAPQLDSSFLQEAPL